MRSSRSISRRLRREQLAKFTSFAGTGTYAGYETEQMEVPAEIYVKAPNQMATIAKSPAGVSVKAFDGRNGWRLQPDTPSPLLPLTGGNLSGAAIEAMDLVSRVDSARVQ